MNSPVTGIGNIILPVRDIQRSLAFYRDTMGLSVRAAGGEFAFLAAGGVTLCLRQDARPQAHGDTSRIEIVFDVPDIHAAYEELKRRGVAFMVEPRVVTGTLWATDFRDPDGHLLSIFGPSASQAHA